MKKTQTAAPERIKSSSQNFKNTRRAQIARASGFYRKIGGGGVNRVAQDAVSARETGFKAGIADILIIFRPLFFKTHYGVFRVSSTHNFLNCKRFF